MQRIIAPLQFGDQRVAVANLQDILQLFCDRIAPPNHEAVREAITLLTHEYQDF